jgi:Cys-rich repeat protein
MPPSISSKRLVTTWLLAGWGCSGMSGCDGSTIALLPTAAGAGLEDAAPCGEEVEGCSGRRAVCDQLRGVCVECLTDGDCDEDEVCDAAEGRCRHACAADADCAERDDDRTVCDTSRAFCVECTSDAGCVSEPRTLCLLSSGECVECLSNESCGAGEPYCDSSSGRCEECLLDEHCGEGGVCDLDDESCL